MEDQVDKFCQDSVEEYGAFLDRVVDLKDFNPDEICFEVDECEVQEESGEICRMFEKGYLPGVPLKRAKASRGSSTPNWTSLYHGKIETSRQKLLGIFASAASKSSPADDSLPLRDRDNDKYAPADTMTNRGQHYKGTDCNDSVRNGADIYPGRNPIHNNFDENSIDSNCNGIFGPDSESKYCQSAGDDNDDLPDPYGLLVLGDSASAHFHIPQNYVRPKFWDRNNLAGNFKNVLSWALDELDFPQTSWASGHMSVNDYKFELTDDFINQGQSQGMPEINSIYKRIIAENKCNNNDFQNIAMNGRRSKTQFEHINGVARNSSYDYPVLAFLPLIGNDVCGKSDQLESMTTPEDFYFWTNETLTYLNRNLPRNSEVYISGLADGRFLYDSIANHQHPIGHYYNNMKVGYLYNYVSCLKITPCKGWLTPNKQIRNRTTQRATQLSKAAKAIVKDAKNDPNLFPNLKINYYDFDLNKMMNNWLDRGGYAPFQIVDGFDGFHPSQIGMSLQADYIWEDVVRKNSLLSGKVNKFNFEIFEKFGI